MIDTDAGVPHQAIYRRWRAQRFSEIVGQGPVVTTLRNAVRSGRLAHALLFVGPRGTGKTSLARIVAKALNCTDLRDGEPCDKCPSCVAIREGRALDVIEMDAASNNRVDDIRELLPRIQTAPSDLRRKVFIIDEVQRIKEGWDVLLKTLEEPPDHVAFVFCTTDSSQVRPAVLSRVQRFDFRRLTVAEIVGKLETIIAAEGRTADPEALQTIARLAAGGMRDAESMLDQVLASSGGPVEADMVRALLGLADHEAVDGFARALVDADAPAGLAILADLEDRGIDLRVFLDQVVERLRSSITEGLAGRGGDLAALSSAAGALAAIDPTRPGTGGLRLRLELVLLTPRALMLREPRASGAPQAMAAVDSSEPARRPMTRASSRPSQNEITPAPPPSRRSAPAGRGGAAPDGVPAGRTRSPASSEASSVAPTTSAEPAPSVPPTTSGAPAPTSMAPAPVTPPRQAAPVATAATDDASALEALREQWPEIVAYLSAHPPTKPLISACRPISVTGDVVTLGFPEGQAFLAEVARKRGSQLEAGIGRFLGRQVTVTCIATNVDLEPGPVDAEGARLLAEARRIFAEDLPDVGEVG